MALEAVQGLRDGVGQFLPVGAADPVGLGEVPRVVGRKRGEQGGPGPAVTVLEEVDDLAGVDRHLGEQRTDRRRQDVLGPGPGAVVERGIDLGGVPLDAPEQQPEEPGRGHRDHLLAGDLPHGGAVADDLLHPVADLAGGLQVPGQDELADRDDDGDEREVAADERKEDEKNRGPRRERCDPGQDDTEGNGGDADEQETGHDEAVAVDEEPLHGPVGERGHVAVHPVPGPGGGSVHR
ncbi:hypothetical protein BRD11_04665 [Halobacteriales archaeon SW_12_69_24]|nr:MAG: hypothetical protein BRD11_04665 [Halobacteriales archaeon SW_12_69_24]